MSKGRSVAQWHKRGRIWVVYPPNWPKNTELSFTDQALMTDWAHNNGIILRDVTPREGRNERFAARGIG